MPPLPRAGFAAYLDALEHWRRRPFDWAEHPDLFVPRSPRKRGGGRGR